MVESGRFWRKMPGNRRLRYCGYRQYLPTVVSISYRLRSTAPVRLWYFPQDICQSRICGRQETSQACVTIALLIATDRFDSPSPHHLSPILDPIFANRIVENLIIGNELHEQIFNGSPPGDSSRRLTVPRAIAVINRHSDLQLSEFDHVSERRKSITVGILNRHVQRFCRFWDKRVETTAERCPNLAMVTISNRRAVLFIYQPSNGILLVIDTHSHRDGKGALVAAAKLVDSKILFRKVFRKIFPAQKRCSKSKNCRGYEISVITACRPMESS